MSWIIRNAAGAICGRCTHKPAPGNKIPDGAGGLMDEVPEYVEDDPKEPGYRADAIAEVNTFIAAQEARVDLSAKRGAALAALEQQRLTEAAAKPDAPQAVRDYAVAVDRARAP